MKRICIGLMVLLVLLAGSVNAAPGDVWDLSDALLASIDPNTANWGDPNTHQNPKTIGDATWSFHPANPANPYTTYSITPAATFNGELPTQGRGWGINHVCLVSYLSANGANTSYQIGDVGGHGATGATWTSDVGGTFLIEYSAFNARLNHNGRNMAFTLTVAGVVENQIDVPDTTYWDSFHRYWGTPIIRTLTAGQNVTLNLTAGDWLGCSLTITEIDPSGGLLTINATPAYVNTVLPYVGGPNAEPVLAPIAIDAQQYINCENNGEVLVFDHWVEGANVSIANLTDPSTTVTILAPGQADITVVYADGRVCGDVCHPIISADLQPDCVIDVLDLAVLASQWLTDNSVQ